MAEAAFSAEIKRKSLPAVATSAGLNVSPTERDMNEKAAKTLENTGLMLPYFSSTSLTKETLLSADIVLCMTRAQSELLKPARKRFLEEAGKPSAKNNVFCFADLTGEDIPDPYGKDEKTYAETLEKFSVRTSNDCLLRRRVDKAMADAVRDWCRANGVDGIQIRQDTRRVYPQGDFMGGILGFTDVDNAGLWGLELRYNDELTGQNGRILTAKNAWGYDMPTHYQTLVDAVPGSTLTLTIDANIQHWLESALSAAVTEHHVAERGVGIVMDVHTGAVLAMSCQPDYDPNAPRTLINKEVRDAVNALTGEERSAALQKAQQAQWRNKAISDLYEPGSVFKLITASAALDSGACKATDYFTCAGKITVAGTRFRCANGHIHGTETFARGLAVSCNPCFIQIGARLGKERFCDYFAAFGLREATGIDLPGEVRRSEYYTADRMGPVELASCSFGQSSKVSYLQMLTAVCAVVNGGELMQPYVVAKITAPDGTVVKEVQPTVKRRVISEETSATMCRLMEGVVTGGTGKQAALAGYRIGGKSGTSEQLNMDRRADGDYKKVASFAAVLPANDPEILVYVMLDDPNNARTDYSSILAAPVVGNIISEVAPYLGLATDGVDRGQTSYKVPNLIGQEWSNAQVSLNIKGLKHQLMESSSDQTAAVVTYQYPRAGAEVPYGTTIYLYTDTYEGSHTEVPDVSGKSAEFARQMLAAAGLNCTVEGDANGLVQSQSEAPGTSVQRGTIVTITCG